MSEHFYRTNLNTELYPIKDILQIECADGEMLPYIGYTEADIMVPGLCDKGQGTILLVVPDTVYNGRVPVLLGTNSLRPLMNASRQEKGTTFLQKIATNTSWWLTFRCMSIQERAVN